MSEDDDYGLADVVELEEIDAPNLRYRPNELDSYDPSIALIGTGGISEQHLDAYTSAGYDIVALCNRTREKAVEKNQEYSLGADVYDDYREVLKRDDIEVVDVLPHPENRVPIIKDALRAGKHVLSQKPFVVDLDEGEHLVDLAEDHGVKLAVNQNGRWAPHWSYARTAIDEGLIGQPTGIHFAVDWDHNWIAETAINGVEHAILYDFAVHWFDILTCFLGDRKAVRVSATYGRSPSQRADPPMIGQALVEYEDVQASLFFNGDTALGPEDRTVIVGTEGTIKCEGPDLEQQAVTLFTDDGFATPDLTGAWFPDGFHGAMAELLSAIEDDREPYNSGRNNLRTLELCYAAVASAEDHEYKTPGEVRSMRGH